jgi:deoxyribodipyrimidine photolyase-related protein
MSVLRDRLAAHATDPSGRTWFFVPYDQLHADFGPWSRLPAREVGVVLVESAAKGDRRPYHQQKLALLLASQRHFAVELAARGVAVDLRRGEAPYAAQLRGAVADHGPLTMMRPAERELRAELAGLVADGALVEVPHEGWLTRADDLAAIGGPPWRMDAFYRRVRQRTGALMEGGKPVGGRYSFDGENRRPWRGDPPAPPPPTFAVDPLTAEVGDLVRRRFGHHPGALHLDRLPTTAADAEALWAWAKTACLPAFGPYEDAMSARSRGLFHTRIAPLLNLHRLLPRRVVDDVLAADLPLPSREGFVRQILGWREFVHHVHEATDGLRALPDGAAPRRAAPGDGGFAAWSGAPWPHPPVPAGVDGGAAPSVLGAATPVPPAWWGTPSGLACLDTVVAELWDDGWTHHIPRLMVLANLATLLDLDPRALTDWFWVAFIDAFDWVVEPNVLGMGTFAVGELMTTKPYVSGSAYLHKMGDYCGSCAFDPKRDCPIASLYWDFLARHEGALAGNQRMSLALGGLRRRDPDARAADARVRAAVTDALGRGEPVTPAAVAAARGG